MTRPTARSLPAAGRWLSSPWLAVFLTRAKSLTATFQILDSCSLVTPGFGSGVTDGRVGGGDWTEGREPELCRGREGWAGRQHALPLKTAATGSGLDQTGLEHQPSHQLPPALGVMEGP